ncbi:hypothetical protein [Halomicrobium salinisoli]|uniref:hypothetical protein n=1 Tax=Halomicrobium salinisoli TaxID=2878391 RepID=UPI001CF09C00|nr:hypothetical protein [Halomicrobium salinisoli]
MSRNEASSRAPVRRRTVLRRLGAGLAAAGIATSGTAAAQSGGSGVTAIDLRESGDKSFPVVDELLVFAHGWHGSSAGPNQAATFADTLAAAGYEPDRTVAFVYRADAQNPDGALEQASEAGAGLAPLVQSALDEGVGSIRLASHSLGGRVLFDALDALEAGYVVDTVAPMGIPAVGSTVTEGGRWYDAIADHAAAVRNYHSRNDGVIMGDFGPDSRYGDSDDTALGAQGAPDASATPDGYADVDVTDTVSGHGGYMSSSEVGQDLAAAIGEQDDDGDDDRPPAVGDSDARPTDPDGDGLYEDLNGNGETDYSDVVRYFDNMDDPAMTDHVDAYDYNGNGEVDFADLVDLFGQVQ